MRDASLVSILIVNWNGEDVLPNLFNSLKNLTYRNFEIIFVDNGSTDSSLNLIEKNKHVNYKLKILCNSRNLGFAPANNQALKKAKGKYLLLLNTDTVVPKNLLEVLVEKMKTDSKIGALQPKILMMDSPKVLDNCGSFLNSLGFTNHWGFGQKDGDAFNRERQVFAVKGACLFTKRDVVEKTGLFDDDFVSYFEESDFCWRVWLAGYKVLYYPKVSIYHKVGFTSKKLPQTEVNFHGIKNRILSFIKNFELKNLILMLSKHLIILFGLCVYYFAKFQPQESFMILRGVCWNLVNLGGSISKRKHVQKNIRKVEDREILPIILQDTNLLDMVTHFRRVEKNFEK